MGVDAGVTAIALFRTGTGTFDEWASALVDSALVESASVDSAGAGGALRADVGVIDGDRFEFGVAATFVDEAALDAWLDGPASSILADAASSGWVLAAPVILVGDGLSVPPGVGVFRHLIDDDRRTEFLAAQRLLTQASSAFAGYEGTSVFVDAASGRALSVLRFRSDRTLANWVSSPERAAALPELRSALVGDFTEVGGSTPFGTVVRSANGRTVMTPNWKSAMLVLLVLYPTVMTLSRFLGPVLDHAGASPGVALWLSQVVSVGLMQWWLMPWASRPFRRWLDPIDGGGWRSNVAGAAVIVMIYVATLTLFESVRWLQFWDYAN